QTCALPLTSFSTYSSDISILSKASSSLPLLYSLNTSSTKNSSHSIVLSINSSVSVVSTILLSSSCVLCTSSDSSENRSSYFLSPVKTNARAFPIRSYMLVTSCSSMINAGSSWSSTDFVVLFTLFSIVRL